MWLLLPFLALLFAIAVGPLWLTHWWEQNRSKFIAVVLLALPIVVVYLREEPRALVHTVLDYAAFITPLAALFIVSGGIRVTGDLVARPATNTAFLATGALLASFIGTTGASMLLVRPLLSTNRERTRVSHTIVFFIFLVSNIGGMLTPLGDPPLFLGYLNGVPFTWTLRLWPIWLVMVITLLAVYYLIDSRVYAAEPEAVIQRDRSDFEPVRLEGTWNVACLVAIVAIVALAQSPWREALVIGVVLLSWLTTPEARRRANRFTFSPMLEVTILFFGIFVTMMPALEMVRVHGPQLGVREPWQFFWVAGLLSSVLDNAPTYATFLTLGRSLSLAPEVAGVPHAILTGLSVGAVAMGAITYIGNAPNFMVRAIAEDAGVKMPGFFGYIAWSAAILLPLFVLVTLVFFRA
jgi:Na+/H+ antiporter NhaD/arsenite permease-like protein